MFTPDESSHHLPGIAQFFPHVRGKFILGVCTRGDFFGNFTTYRLPC